MSKKRYALSLLAIILAFSCVACSAKSTADTAQMADSPAAAPAAMMPQTEAASHNQGIEPVVQMQADRSEGAAEGDGTVPLQDRKLIRHSNLSLETMEFDAAIEQLTQLVTQAGGYIESQSIDGRSLHYQGDYYERSAQIGARVPTDRLDELTASVGSLCNITAQSESMEDITDRYFDTKVHLDTLHIQEERLIEILKKAEKLEDVITLERALSEVRYEIESLTAAIKRMDSQISYSYLNLDLREVSALSPVAQAPRTFTQKLKAAFVQSGDHLIQSLQNTVLYLVEVAPTLLVWAALLVAVLMATLAIVRKGRGKRIKAVIKSAPPSDQSNDSTQDNQE